MEVKKLRIGVTYTETRNENYPKWIKGNDENIEVVELHWNKQSLDEVWDMIEDLDGVVLTGGVDTHPEFYGNERTEYPNGDGTFNRERDEFEMHVFETVLNFKHPVLAICRGLQLVNIALGGTLIQDLEEAGKEDHRRFPEKDREHEVTVNVNSLLGSIAGTLSGTINSAHHQAIDVLSDELMATAFSPDGVIEAVEWKNKADEPWMLCVQWHPERMSQEGDSPFSKKIRERFLEAAAL
jgi:putative glutamine amidotransferase